MATDITKTKTRLADFIADIGIKSVDERLKFLSKRIAELITETTPLQEEFARLQETKKEMSDFIDINKAAKKI